jgi:hypothetical protein
LKSVFLATEVQPLRPPVQHTHGKSAAARSTGSLLIDRVAKSIGAEPVFFQGSSSDKRKGRKITRSHLWAKDLLAEQEPIVEDPEVVAMVDVDYYVDMRRYLTLNFQPTLLYTFQPSGVCRCDGEYKYTFHQDNTVEYTVSGGGRYRHPVWNWDGDSLMVFQRGWHGLINQVAMFSLERRRIDEDHQVILLAPLRRYRGVLSANFAARHLYAPSLDILRVNDGMFSRLRINTDTGIYQCTGLAGGYTQAKISCAADDALACTNRTSKSVMTVSCVKGVMERDGGGYSETVHLGCEVLHEYHTRNQPKTGPVVSTLTDAVRRFQWVAPDRDPDADAKPGMVAFMLPLLHGGFAPDQCYGNDHRAATERVTKLKKPTQPELSNFVSDCMDEFVEQLFVGRKHFLGPVSVAEVYARQDRPAQRRILDAAHHEEPTSRAKNFVKKEAYPSVTDPRMITTINGSDKLQYSRFMYALKDYIKTKDWYAFSKSPQEIAERVAAICCQSNWVDNTDFSRMDGNVDALGREFERRIAIYGFRKDCTSDLLKLMRNQYCLKASTPFGVRYDTGYARSSGSPETSEFNTLLNAFIAYMGYRRTRRGTSFMTPTEVYFSLGIYGGDDGLSADMCRDGAIRSARSMGQTLDLVRVPRGSLGVTFLARRYGPDVWFGDSNSCCDIVRQLSKFHLTVALPSNITPLRKLQEKAFAFWLTDRNTPIIGDFVCAVLEMHPYSRDEWENICGMWRMTLDESKQYPNTPADWMNEIVRTELPNFDHQLFSDWIQCEGCGDWFKPPEFNPRSNLGLDQGLWFWKVILYEPPRKFKTAPKRLLKEQLQSKVRGLG